MQAFGLQVYFGCWCVQVVGFNDNEISIGYNAVNYSISVN